MLVPKSVQEDLKQISIRSRMAMAITCLKPILDHYHINISEKESLLDIFWQFVENKDLAEWDSNTRKVDSLMAICDFIESEIELPPTLDLRRLPRFVLEIIYEIYNLGLGNLYAGVVSYSPSTYRSSLYVLDLVLNNGFTIPSIEPFLKSPFTERGGFGNNVPRTFFTSQGLP
jgi:hypothetical protein